MLIRFILMCFLPLSFLAAQDAGHGQKLFSKCIACHGADGYGKKSQSAPMLAGQYDWYLKAQIIAIRDQVRTAGQVKKMYPFVKNLTDTEVADIAAYVSQLPKKK